MTREIEYAKCIAVLRKMVHMNLISESEYKKAKVMIMDKYLIVHDHDKHVA